MKRRAVGLELSLEEELLVLGKQEVDGQQVLGVFEVLPLSQAVKSEMLRVLLESCLRAFRTF